MEYLKLKNKKIRVDGIFVIITSTLVIILPNIIILLKGANL